MTVKPGREPAALGLADGGSRFGGHSGSTRHLRSDFSI